MNPTIAIQDVLIPHREVVRDIDACREAGIEPIRFGLIPFSDIISTDDNADLKRPAVPFGSTKLIKLWLQDKTPPWWRVFYHPGNFDWCIWAKAIGKNALNGPTMGRVCTLEAVQDLEWKERIFVKPTTDLKAFAGMVLSPGETIRGRLAQSTQDSSLSDQQPIIWAPWQEILCEYRCFMHKGELIDASRYKTGERADHKPVDDIERNHLRVVAKELAECFIPARFYAVDLAFMPSGHHKVVEYNCLNCSGRYAVDRGKLLRAVLND